MVDAINQNLNASLYGIAKEIYTQRTEDDVSIYDANNPSAGNDCVNTYLKGEQEIQKLITRRLSTIMGFGLNTSKIADEVRAEYEQQHPEYAAAKKEYENLYSTVNQNHARYMEENLRRWDEEHTSNPYGTLGASTAYNKSRQDYISELEKGYRSQNPDYDAYRKQVEMINKNNKSSVIKGLIC